MPSAGYVSLNHILLGPTGCYPGLVSRDPAACTDTGTLHLGPLSSRLAPLTRQLDGSTGDGDSLASQLSHSPSTEDCSSSRTSTGRHRRIPGPVPASGVGTARAAGPGALSSSKHVVLMAAICAHRFGWVRPDPFPSARFCSVSALRERCRFRPCRPQR